MKHYMQQDSEKWFHSFAHWGECFIERSCTEHDPQWKGSYCNGIPYIRFMDGIYDPQLAEALCEYLNQIYDTPEQN